MRCPTNEELFDDNGFILDSLDELDSVFCSIDKNPSKLSEMKEKSIMLAQKKLDYKKLFEDTLKYSGIQE